jgi:hypothetical protein
MISFSNSKLKRDGIASFSIPAGSTCPNKDTCAKGCYAMQGFFLMPNVRMALKRNYLATKCNSFVDKIDSEIRDKKVKTLRIHASGDFYNKDYLLKWLRIARLNPHVKFYAYTKMVSLVKSFLLPSNLTIIFSYGGKEDYLIKATDRHSRVFPSWESMKKAKYSDTTTNDINALGKNKRVGLVYHGAKTKAFLTI